MCIEIFQIKSKLFENYKTSEGYPVVGSSKIINLEGNSNYTVWIFLKETFMLVLIFLD